MSRRGVTIQMSQICEWNVEELRLIDTALDALQSTAHWSDGAMKRNLAPTGVQTMLKRRIRSDWYGEAPFPDVFLYERTFQERDTMLQITVVHELAHIWDFGSKPKYTLSDGLIAATGGTQPLVTRCVDQLKHEVVGRWFCLGKNQAWQPVRIYDPKGTPASAYGASALTEDWAESVAAVVFPQHPRYTHIAYDSWWNRITGNGHMVANIDTVRVTYVHEQFRKAQ